MVKRLTLKIYGQVQGVGFRANVYYKAKELGLTGWVRNEPDGLVRILAQGEEKNLQELTEWCKIGTRFAKVERVEVGWQEAIGEFDGFGIMEESP